MSGGGEIGSIRPNPYLFEIENRKKRRPRLAHDLGAGAKCNKCGDKCTGFELHFWRKICMNCRCSKDDHEVEDDEEDIGQIVIGKLFDRPARTQKEEMEYCHGEDLEIVNEDTGKTEKLKFDWVPPNVEKTLASRYMELLPPDKRPIAGTEAAKARKRQLEQQIPLYDMDAAQRSDSLPPEELQNFQAYLERIRTQVVGQGSVQEIVGAIQPSQSQPLVWQSHSDQIAPESIGGSMDPNGNINSNSNSVMGNNNLSYNPLEPINTNNNAPALNSDLKNNTESSVSHRKPSLRQQFLGGMVGDPTGMTTFKPEDIAHSTPYGGTRMNAIPLQGISNDPNVEGISAGLADLNVQNRLQGNVQGQRIDSTVIQPPQIGIIPPSSNLNDVVRFPPSISGPRGYRPVRPAHLPVPSSQSVLSGDSDYKMIKPGYEPRLPGQYASPRGEEQANNPNHPSFLPGPPNYLPPKPPVDETEYQPGDEAFPPPPPELLEYPSDYPRSDAASSDSGVEIYDNTGASLRTRVDEEERRAPLQQMHGRHPHISAVEATQAPYGAQLDTLTGAGMSIAPGTDVNVLFPGESQIIQGSPANRGLSSGRGKSKYSCQGCEEPMGVGDVAIFCERAGEDKCWHPTCFCCHTCKDLLADLIYFYKDGKVFCGRHFTAAEEMPRCKACDELIFGNSWTRADGFDWHINHFCCNVCDSELAGQRYVPDQNGIPYCLPCYMACVAKMCEACEEKINPEVNRCGHRGYFYHATPQCFKCYTCQDSLLGKRFKMSKNWVFCSNECIQKVAEEIADNPNPKMKEEI